ncbi:MAG TPA: hypothetical protein VFH61_06980 [Thermoleophilia bacterium]|nr:hypothetical protein [Thermoleophilia bacterium]
MISIEVLRTGATSLVGDGFPLVFWSGQGRVVGSDEVGLDLLVRGMRARYTWDRLDVTLRRLFANHTLGVDELGGGHDAVGVVSLFALLLADDVKVIGPDGLLVLRRPEGTPIHQYADMSRPR